ncbi:MAG: hypothetical protein JO227_10295, partial [Acetobacteraceae bacterium]|nr:hypothetical protein [Acetobacteraceae bacterium]
MRDVRGLPLSTDSSEAAALFDRAVEHYLKFHADTPGLLDQALAADADFVMGHVFKGYMLLSAANPSNRAAIASNLLKAQQQVRNATFGEQMHVAAFQAWAEDALDQSFNIWRQILDEAPTDLLAVRICDTTWFRHGQTALIREQADRVAKGW